MATTVAADETARAGQIVGIRHWSAPDHTRVVLDLGESCRFVERVLVAPDRLVVDLPGSTFGSGVTPFEVGDGLVHRVRLNRLGGPKAQVVLDLAGPRDYRVFELDAYERKPSRIVIDVYRSSPTVDPDELAKPDGNGIPLIVLDPGHGGDDPGAIGRGGLKEKVVCLDLALELKRQLEREAGVKVVLTRSGDYYVPLRKRYRVAEKHRADLFVSIHANSARNRRASGAEVFFHTYGAATDREARELAELENAADLIGGAPPEAEDDLLTILADLQKTSAQGRSSVLSEAIVDALDTHGLIVTRTRKQSVKQARFVVLRSASVPSVLVEVGFLSNPRDADVMRRGDFTTRCARSLRDGVSAYLKQVKAAEG